MRFSIQQTRSPEGAEAFVRSARIAVRQKNSTEVDQLNLGAMD